MMMVDTESEHPSEPLGSLDECEVASLVSWVKLTGSRVISPDVGHEGACEDMWASRANEPPLLGTSILGNELLTASKFARKAAAAALLM